MSVIEAESAALLEAEVGHLWLSATAYNRIIKIIRTIANLDMSSDIPSPQGLLMPLMLRIGT